MSVNTIPDLMDSSKETAAYWRAEAEASRVRGYHDLAYRWELLAAVMERTTTVRWEDEA